QKERILELKRRYFEDYYSNNQYAASIKEDMAYPCLNSLKTTKETSLIRRIQCNPIRRIGDIVCEYSGGYQTWSLLQETPIRIIDAPPSPNHIIDFHANEPALELEDLVIEVEEDPEEDSDMDIHENEEDDDWLMASVTPPRAASLTRIEYMQTSLVRKVDGVSDAQVADSIAIGEL
ncbi:hypothetical protein Tco_0200321, partial [Tanacetum coccineum]